ncbi:MAG: hypothetical protein MZV63_55190 [Marinilabiliales bacterium]|nr:hypothetical protein [Marinilabiliales bacterium]
MSERNICMDVLFGVAVGDALGVFPWSSGRGRSSRKDPVIGYAWLRHARQPLGTLVRRQLADLLPCRGTHGGV